MVMDHLTVKTCGRQTGRRAAISLQVTTPTRFPGRWPQMSHKQPQVAQIQQRFASSLLLSLEALHGGLCVQCSRALSRHYKSVCV